MKRSKYSVFDLWAVHTGQSVVPVLSPTKTARQFGRDKTFVGGDISSLKNRRYLRFVLWACSHLPAYCWSTFSNIGPTCRSDFVADKSASVHTAHYVRGVLPVSNETAAWWSAVGSSCGGRRASWSSCVLRRTTAAGLSGSIARQPLTSLLTHARVRPRPPACRAHWLSSAAAATLPARRPITTGLAGVTECHTQRPTTSDDDDDARQCLQTRSTSIIAAAAYTHWSHAHARTLTRDHSLTIRFNAV